MDETYRMAAFGAGSSPPDGSALRHNAGGDRGRTRGLHRHGRRDERFAIGAGVSADLSLIIRGLRFLAGGDVRRLALATISIAEIVAA